jgi:hypothetical protein
MRDAAMSSEQKNWDFPELLARKAILLKLDGIIGIFPDLLAAAS